MNMSWVWITVAEAHRNLVINEISIRPRGQLEELWLIHVSNRCDRSNTSLNLGIRKKKNFIRNNSLVDYSFTIHYIDPIL